MDEEDIQSLQEQQYRQELFQTTLAKCSNRSTHYIRYSKLFKILNINMFMIMTVGVTVLSILLAVEKQDYLLAGIGFGINAMQLIHKGFNIGSQGIEYRNAGSRIVRLRRQLVHSMRDGKPINYIDKLVDMVNDELEDLDLRIFSKSYGPGAINFTGDTNIDIEANDA